MGRCFKAFRRLVRTGAGLVGDDWLSTLAVPAVVLVWRTNWFVGWRECFLCVGINGLPDEWILNFLHPFPPPSEYGGEVLFGDGGRQWEVAALRRHNYSSETSKQLFQSGECLMLLAALSMAVGTVMIGLFADADPVTATDGTWSWVAILPSAGVIAAVVDLDPARWMALGIQLYSGVRSLTVCSSTSPLAAVSPVCSLTFLTPVFALLFGNLFLGEVLSPLQWELVTLISIYLINQRETLVKAGKKIFPNRKQYAVWRLLESSAAELTSEQALRDRIGIRNFAQRRKEDNLPSRAWPVRCSRGWWYNSGCTMFNWHFAPGDWKSRRQPLLPYRLSLHKHGYLFQKSVVVLR